MKGIDNLEDAKRFLAAGHPNTAAEWLIAQVGKLQNFLAVTEEQRRRWNEEANRLKSASCCKAPDYCDGECTCEICAPDEHIAQLKGEVAHLQTLVPHPGDGSCEWCGFGPATAVTLCEECRGPVAEAVRLTGHIDLMVDEFKRIKALTWSNSEIVGLCDRAITNTKQWVPVIEQRDEALAKAEAMEVQLSACQEVAVKYSQAEIVLSAKVRDLEERLESALKTISTLLER